MSQRAFKTAEELEQKFRDYIEYCHKEEKLANIAGFCVFCDINRDTYYAQKEYYSDTIKKIEQMLEEEAINCKSINDTFKIFYMKNKFSEDYRDRQELSVTQKVYDIEG